MSKDTFRVLFVCLGNICRSPAAEGIFKSIIRSENLSDKIICESAGTAAYHTGSLPDSRMRSAAEKRGVILNSRARQIKPSDLENFDWIITMDEMNYQDVLSIDEAGKYSRKVIPFCTFCKRHKDGFVPDPYYGGLSGFEHVLNLLEDGCMEMLKRIKEENPFIAA